MWNDSFELSHAHYSAAVQEAVSVFVMTHAAWNRMRGKDLRENMIRLDALQTCWDTLAQARKAETGCGFYLDEQQYAEAVASISKGRKS